MVDLAIGLVYPCLMIALQYIVQGHRFNIFEDIGCFPFTYNTPPAFVLVHIQPLLVGVISFIYCVLSIRLFYKRHAQFNEFLSSHKNLNTSRYLRLMMLAGIEMIATIPLASWVIANNVKVGVAPWLGWNDTHYGFSRVDQFPAMFWRRIPGNVAGLEFTRWIPVICAFVFFGFFGFADEARKNYRSAVETVAKKMGYSTFTLTGTRTASSSTSTVDGGMSRSGMSSSGKIKPVAPVFIHTDMLTRPRSFASLTDVSVSFNDAGGLLDEKEKGSFSPDASIGGLTMAEINGVAADYNSDAMSSVPSSGPSSPTSSPNLSRQPSRNSIHISDHSAV